MNTLRLILGWVGTIGLVLWCFFNAAILLFWGFKPGGPQGGMTLFQWLLCLGTVMIGFVYDWVVSWKEWTRTLYIAGAVIQSAVLIAILAIVLQSDGGFLFAPFLLIGPAVWLVYAAKNSKSKTIKMSGQLKIQQ